MAKDKTPKPKNLSLEETFKNIESQFGKGSIMRLSDVDSRPDVKVFSTGSLNLDIALGVGGLPAGRIVELYGQESSGKTTTALHCIAEVQKVGGTCAFIDAEHAIDINYAENLGVDISSLLLSQPSCGEEALEITNQLVLSEKVALIVVDSVAALTPQAELDGDMGSSHMGLQARLMGQALRKLAGACSRTNTTIIFLNQMRQKIGVMFGNPDTTSGGNALKFYASVRLQISKTGVVKDDERSIANASKVKVIKNKVAPPFTEAEFEIVYGKGIDRNSEIALKSVELGLVEKAGAWLTVNGARVQGMDAFKALLTSRPELAVEFENKILQTANITRNLQTYEQTDQG